MRSNGSRADPTDLNMIADKWNHIEGLGSTDVFLVCFFRRYGQLIYNLIDKPKEDEIKRTQNTLH
jgi:hypothetical protein